MKTLPVAASILFLSAVGVVFAHHQGAIEVARIEIKHDLISYRNIGH